MNFDFAIVLVAATFVTGLGWLVDKLWFEPARKQRIADAEAAAGQDLPDAAKEKLGQMTWWADFSKSMFPVLAVVLVVRSFLVEPFQIPSGSMLPTLKVGDFILVNKYQYGLRLPVLNSKIIDIDMPHRGDVVVFKYPGDPSINYIKRVIGLPGDKITYKDKMLFINGEPQPQTLQAKLPPKDPKISLYKEELGDVTHQIYTDIYRPNLDGDWVVPDGQYFVMGDNRDNSNDSRYWGFVPDELLVGKAFGVWMHWPNFTSIPDLTAIRGIQ